MWSIIVFLAVGALSGWIACKIIGLKGSLLLNIIVGIAGAAVGQLAGKLLDIYTGFLTFSVGSVLSAVIGALILAFVVALVLKKKGK